MVYIIIIVALLFILLSVLVIKALNHKPTNDAVEKAAPITVDEARIIESLQTMIQFKTISYQDTSKEDKQAFKAFREYIQTRYPTILSKGDYKEIEDTGFLIHLKGKHHDKSIVFMSHYDVVPENGTWQHDPFSGKIIDGKIYGRGTLDTKSTLASILEAMEHLLNEGVTLTHDYYLCFSGDEETRGPSANNIVQYLKTRGVKPSLVLDEGGAVVENIFPGVKKKTAVIGVAEKGYMNVRLSATASGGHASMPPASMPLSDLSLAVSRLHKGNVFKMKTLSVTKAMLTEVSKHSESFVMRLLFANLWLFMPVIKMNAKKSGGEMLSLFKTTQAFTMAEGSNAMNVLPSTASIGINYRLLQGDTINSTLSRIKKRIKNDTIEVQLEKGAEATSISKTTGLYDTLTRTIKETWGDVITTPYLMMAGTDSRYHHAISDHVYRFSPMEMTKAERETIHSTEEAIRIDQLLTCVRFYISLIKNINSN